MLPLPQIAESVTAEGRNMLEFTRDMVEKTIRLEGGYPGNAQVIYGDTDSVMIRLGFPTQGKPVMDRHRAIQIGQELAQAITKHFPSPIKLAFEKIYHPYFLFMPKRYAGVYFTQASTMDKLDIKGIEMSRTDSCALVRETQSHLLNLLLLNEFSLTPKSSLDQLEDAKSYVIQLVGDLYRNEVDYAKLMLKKSIRTSMDEYKTCPPHIKLARRMAKEDPLAAPHEGDSVFYFVVAGHKKSKVGDRVVSVEELLRDNLVPYGEYYAEEKLRKPITKMLSHIFDKKTIDYMFDGPHTQTAIRHASKVLSSVGMLKYVELGSICLGCKVPLEKGQMGQIGSICPSCILQQDTMQKIKEEQERLKTKEKDLIVKCSKVREICEQCKHIRYQDIQCAAYDCFNFWIRNQVHDRLKLTQSQLFDF
jgi:DNA polymerase delta subunit 1